MNEQQAREILGDAVNKPYGSNLPKDTLSCLGHYMAWSPGDDTITLDSEFELEEIEAIAWWIKNKGTPVHKAEEAPSAGVKKPNLPLQTIREIMSAPTLEEDQQTLNEFYSKDKVDKLLYDRNTDPEVD